MSSFMLELRKEKRTCIALVLLMAGFLGAAYAAINYYLRKDVLLGLPIDPTDAILTQIYGMLSVLNIFAVITASCMIYNMEFKGNAIKKMYLLPVSVSEIYFSKFLILTAFLAIAEALEFAALAGIGAFWLPEGTFHVGKLLAFAGYSFLTSMPVLSFMVLVSSRCENIWVTLGIGVAGFLSGMALVTVENALLLLHPFVLTLKPAIGMTSDIDAAASLTAALETFAFLTAGLWAAKHLRYE